MTEDPAAEEPYIFTTLRWDPTLLESAANSKASCDQPCPFYMLKYHWARLQPASQAAIATPAALLESLSHQVQQWHLNHPNDSTESLRIKYRIYANGRTVTEISPITRIPLRTLFPVSFLFMSERPAQMVPWTATLDTVPTTISSHTRYKTSSRIPYDRARAAANITSYADTVEVLLYNDNDEILDGSITTPYFLVKDEWVTPAAACGGQQGTTRQWALAQGLCVEGVVESKLLQRQEADGKIVWLSNGVRGFFEARIKMRSTDGEAS